MVSTSFNSAILYLLLIRLWILSQQLLGSGCPSAASSSLSFFPFCFLTFFFFFPCFKLSLPIYLEASSSQNPQSHPFRTVEGKEEAIAAATNAVTASRYFIFSDSSHGPSSLPSHERFPSSLCFFPSLFSLCLLQSHSHMSLILHPKYSSFGSYFLPVLFIQIFRSSLSLSGRFLRTLFRHLFHLSLFLSKKVNPLFLLFFTLNSIIVAVGKSPHLPETWSLGEDLNAA